MIKVGISGYGTIGSRIADAVTKQEDMKLVGVAKTKPDFKMLAALEKGCRVYAVSEENVKNFSERDIKVEGTLGDLAREVDLIIDASPNKFGILNKPIYEKVGIKAIFEGGEKADVAQCSFNSLCNYEEAIDKDYVRVVSCNTTGLARSMGTLKNLGGIGKIRVVLIRRAADPVQSKRGPINAIVPTLKLPSHHGPDLKTVLHDADIVTMAVAVPTTIMHLHTIMVEIKDSINKDMVIDAFSKNPRIRLVNSRDGFRSTAEVMEYARYLGKDRGDMYEIAVWEDSISIDNNELYFVQAVHQESDVVPENIDAIRAITGIEKDRTKSMEKTDKSLGIS